MATKLQQKRTSQTNSHPANNTSSLQKLQSKIQDNNLDTLFVYALAAAYVAIMFTLMVQKHDAFNTRVNDFARFAQAIWNTLDGQFLYTSLSERSILGDHFSPIMALFAPLFWVWPNERVLFLVQAVNVAATGLIIYHMARAKYPSIAVFIALLFFLNPAVHEVTLFELRRIVFGMPWFALGLYGLVLKKHRLMLFGLLIALLSKESIAIYVAMIGVYLIVKDRNWRWGIGLIALGGAWSIIIGAFVIPAFNQGTDSYPQLYYYSHLGATYGDLARLAFTDPMALIRPLTGIAQRDALFRMLIPLGFLALLDLPLVLVTTPYIILMFLSRDVDMFQLDKWYSTTITPILFAALISGWKHVPKRLEPLAIGWMGIAVIYAFGVYSYAPMGGRFDPTIYQVTDRDRVGDMITHLIPDGKSVMSHPLYVPHLTHINEVYHYTQDDPPKHQPDFILIDNLVQFTPFGPFEIRDEVANLVAEPNNVIVAEADGIYLMGLNEPQLPNYDLNKTAENGILLDRMELAIADEYGFYQTTTDSSPTVNVGQMIRVTLYWEALTGDITDRSISTRIAANDGFLLAQQDQMPAANYRPMSWWEKGDTVRDVYYLNIPEGTAPQLGSIGLVLYDSLTQENIRFDGEDEVVRLLSINIAPRK